MYVVISHFPLTLITESDLKEAVVPHTIIKIGTYLPSLYKRRRQ